MRFLTASLPEVTPASARPVQRRGRVVLRSLLAGLPLPLVALLLAL